MERTVWEQEEGIAWKQYAPVIAFILILFGAVFADYKYQKKIN